MNLVGPSLFHVEIQMLWGVRIERGVFKEWLLIAKIITLHFTASSSSSSCQQLTGYIAAVANSALKATSVLNPDGNINYGAENSRLFTARNSTHAGGWLARTNTVTYEYITVSRREHNTNECMSGNV